MKSKILCVCFMFWITTIIKSLIRLLLNYFANDVHSIHKHSNYKTIAKKTSYFNFMENKIRNRRSIAKRTLTSHKSYRYWQRHGKNRIITKTKPTVTKLYTKKSITKTLMSNDVQKWEDHKHWQYQTLWINGTSENNCHILTRYSQIFS